MPDISIVVPRLDEKPWGGRTLGTYGFDLPEGTAIGEALVTAGDAAIATGLGADGTLGDIVTGDPAGRLGARATKAVGGREIFPLLVKLIDAAQNLSIQVHPNDEQAAPLDRLGKTEAWHVLAAEPGSRLYVGLRPGVSYEDFAAAARKLDGSSASLLRALEAKPGTTILLPAGTIHALGAGVMVYEIQQPSDVTFRLDDWGRVDANGNPREMHLEQGFAVGLPDLRPDFIEPIEIAGGRLLVATRYFALERFEIAAGSTREQSGSGSPQVVTVLSGELTVANATETETLAAGHSVVIWPDTDGSVALGARTDVVALRSWVPDLAADIVAAARAAGASDAAIAAIGSPLADVANVLAGQLSARSGSGASPSGS